MTKSIQILSGAEGIKQAYKEALIEKALDIVCPSENYDSILGGFFEKEYAPQLYSQVQTREILPDNQENRNYAKSKDEKKNTVRFMKGESSESDMILSETKAILISYNPAHPFALVVRDQELVRSFKNQFEVLWQALAE